MRLGSFLLLGSLSITAVSAFTPPKCGHSSQCPEKYPCCSQYGQCGTGTYCLGGCDPRFSFSPDSCAPEPICVDKTYTSWSMDTMQSNTKYLGDASKYDWVYSGFPKVQDNNLVMTMPKLSGSTLVASSHYIWYGNVKGKVKSSRDQGVVTGFVLLSDVKDEIDYEFVGDNLTQVQTNYYFEGIPNYTHGGVAPVSGGNTFADWHEYEFDWTPDRLHWIVDGQTVRTLNKADTFNAKTNKFEYPQTPARLEMSLWPGGGANQAPGTVKWAGGPISWNSQDMQQKGYYYAEVGEVSIKCYQPPPGANAQGDVSYIYTNSVGTNSSVEISNKGTVMASLGATGTDMNAGGASPSSSSAPSSSSTSSASSGGSSGNASSGNAPSGNTPSGNVPPGNVPGSNGGSSAGSGSPSSSGSGAPAPSGPGSGSGSGTSNFQQGSGSGGSGSGAAPASRVLSGSLFAIMIGAVVLITL